MTLAQVKAILGITTSDRDAQITALLPGIELFVREHCNDQFLKAKPTTTSTAISFTASTKTIACADFEDYRADYQIVVEDSLYNDELYTIASVGVGTLVVVEDLIDESIGEEITITESILPKQVRIVVAKIINFQLQSKDGIASRKLGDGSESYHTSISEQILDLLPRKVGSV